MRVCVCVYLSLSLSLSLLGVGNGCREICRKVLAHECGHGGFSDSKTLNDCVGWVIGLAGEYMVYDYIYIYIYNTCYIMLYDVIV